MGFGGSSGKRRARREKLLRIEHSKRRKVPFSLFPSLFLSAEQRSACPVKAQCTPAMQDLVLIAGFRWITPLQSGLSLIALHVLHHARLLSPFRAAWNPRAILWDFPLGKEMHSAESTAEKSLRIVRCQKISEDAKRCMTTTSASCDAVTESGRNIAV